MSIREKIIPFWGIMDLAAIGWYILFNIAKGKIPFYSDIVTAKSTSIAFGLPIPTVFASVSIFLYSTLLVSGFLLIKRNKYGAILSYIQCPFRLLTFIPISIFFLTWPVKYIFGMPTRFDDPTIQAFVQAPIIAFLSLMLLSEIIKTATVIRWHVMINKRA
jgi:hypothetical protein